MLRNAMLSLARNEYVTRTVSQNGVSRGFALRFIAGETLDQAIAASRELNAAGMTVTLDALGENVAEQEKAGAAADHYLEILDRIQSDGVDSSISVKLTMLGLDISDDLCEQHMRAILDRASQYNNFVRIDMESSDYTQRTLDMFYRLHADYGNTVGVVLQSYLYRNDADVEHIIAEQARVRLVKGAYAEPATVAYPDKSEVDAAYRRQMERLLDDGNYPAIATQDDAIIDVAKGYALRMGIDQSQFEFQMMYGIRRDLQEQLVSEGYNVRIYVPYGPQWYPYFMRRMAERPANLLFVLRNLMKP